MHSVRSLSELASVLEQEIEPLVSRWMEAAAARSWNLRRLLHDQRPAGKPDATQPIGPASALARSQGAQERPGSEERRPGIPISAQLLRQRCAHFLEAMRASLSVAQRLELGAAEFREPVQALAFTAGWMAGGGLAIGDGVALVLGLQDIVGINPEPLFRSMLVVVTEAFMAAIEQRAQVRYRDAMEKCQLVCALSSRLPCLFLVGDPDRRALDEAIGRVMMLVVMRDAPVLIVDGSGLFAPEQTLPLAVAILQDYHREIPLRIILCGFPPTARTQVQSTGPLNMEVYEDLPPALSRAARACGLSWPLS